jgi:hypothetical protein
VLSCPSDDLDALAEVLARSPIALLPVGGVGDLTAAAGISTLLLVEVTAEGPRSAITWRGRLGLSTPLDPDPEQLLPKSWVERHPDAYARSRQQHATAQTQPADPAGAANEWDSDDWDSDDWDDWADDERFNAVQLFLPVMTLEQIPPEEWLFANELVPKQQRAGRRFAPRRPTLVTIPLA